MKLNFHMMRRGNRGDDDNIVFIRELARLDERQAEREERRMRVSFDEDEVFGQPVANIMKCFTTAQKSSAHIQVL